MLNERQMNVLRMAADGEIVNMGYGNSNVDLRTFGSLRQRGLLTFDPTRPDGQRWYVNADGLSLLGR